MPASVDSTGDTDATASLQSFVNGVPDGGTVRLRKGGNYRLESTLVLKNRHDLTIDGNGARIYATSTGARDRSNLAIIQGSGIVVHDLSIAGVNPYAGLDERGYDPKLAFQHGVDLEGANGVELTRVRITSVYGDFVYVGRSDDGQWSQGVWIHDSAFSGSGRQGLAVAAGRDIVFERNSITNTRRATVDLEPNGSTWGAENVHVLDNVVGPGRLLFIAAAGAGPVDKVVVARNHLSYRSLTLTVRAPSGTRYHDFYVADNTANVPVGNPPLNFSSVTGLVVTGNSQPFKTPGIAFVAATNVCGMTVSGNRLSVGAVPVTVTNPCEGGGPSPALPAAPAAAGRPVSGAPAPTTTSTTSTTTARRTTSGTGITPAPPGPSTGSSSDATTTAMLVALVFVGIAGVGTWVWFRRRDARQRAAADTSSESSSS